MIQIQNRRGIDTRENFAKAALLAGPMLLAGCAGDMAVRQSPLVVAIPEVKSGNEAAPRADEGPKRAPAKGLTTVLDIMGYQGNLLVANLTVVRTNDSLDRIIADPIVTFSSISLSGSWEIIPGCIRVSICMTETGSGRKAAYRAQFTPDKGSALKPALSEPFVFEPAK